MKKAIRSEIINQIVSNFSDFLLFKNNKIHSVKRNLVYNFFIEMLVLKPEITLTTFLKKIC